MATVLGDSNFTDAEAKQMAEKLKNAMDGFGTNEDEIIEVLVTHNNAQRQKIAATYAQAYGKPLKDDLIAELTGDLEECIVALILPPRDLDAQMIHDAIQGAGTNETMLIGVLCSRSNKEILEIKAAYKRMYDADLNDDIQGDTSGYFARMMYSVVTGARQESKADEHLAYEEAQKLIEAGVQSLGTDECAFNAVLGVSSFDHLRLVFKKYQELREGNTIEDDIKSEMSGTLQEGYLAIVGIAQDKQQFFADWLYNTTTGVWGTKDSELIGIIVSRSEEDLKEIKKKFAKKYGTPLEDTVRNECSGYYKRTLLSLIEGRYVSKSS
ncbi:annexin A13-like [Dreissena polymorpha]|uniref:Annexin n=1 Tax=Dreissena polymorpha TaxID=45954 RepID=A0A9D4EHH8_DREPO|nr:annexin A13-like [Dreissena polymorpha]XP_052228675.1 annexin A13-like [Dreissena polymorpha]KAH3779428.1 hypothetical protein DPMN_157231 [Dreissena polymorpha]KAH3779442.1 hypothetical protein DPMN_157245 [Dreissena polymorpha]